MRILDLAVNDLSQIFRDRKILIFLVAMPVVFTFFMGFVYRSVDQTEDPHMSLGWVDHDPEGLLSQKLYELLSSSPTVNLVQADASQAAEQLQQGKLAGVLIIPEAYSAQAIAGEPAQLILQADPASSTTQALQQVLYTPLSQLLSSLEIAQISASLEASQSPFASEAERQAEIEAAFQSALQAWAETSASGSLVVVEQAIAKEPSQPLGGNPYNQSSPGILVQFTIFQTFTSAIILVQERKNRCLQRLMTTAMKPYEVIAGHWLAMFVMVFLQAIILIIFGQLILNVPYLNSLLGTLLVTIGLSLWVASMALLIGVIAKFEEQVVIYSLIAMSIFASLGGAWVPLDTTGNLFSIVGHFTPAAWAIDGYQNILIRGLGAGSIIQPVLILLGYAAVFFGLAVWRFKQHVE